MNSGYTIDGHDILGTYGITVKKITGLHSLLARKGDISQSWPDSDGETGFTDSTDIYFEGRDIMMLCYIQQSTYTLFKSNIDAFRAVLEAAGTRTLVIPYAAGTRTLMYVKGSDIDIITPKSRTSVIVGEFWVQFRELTPARGA